MAAFQNEGYANNRVRRAAFDPLLGAHPFERTRLLTDRSAYVSFLEVQLERVTAACLATQGFSDRIEQLQNQVNALEAARGSSPPARGGASVRAHDSKNTSCSCQATCVRLADDALAAVQATDDRIDKIEKEFEKKVSEHSARMLDLLRQVILKQKDMQIKISGNLEFKEPSTTELRPSPTANFTSDITPPPPTTYVSPPPTTDVTPSSTLPKQKTRDVGARVRAVSAPGAAAAQARRRRALDDLLHELEILEKEGN